MNPYVGLRPFLEDDSLYFFGRDEQSTELLRILHETRFLPVIGSSGSGKSSLVIAGLIPKLLGGFLVGNRDAWRIATLRPGDGPLHSLANRTRRAFGDTEDDAASAAFEQELIDGHTGAFLDYVGAHIAPNENLLVLVDQFEEIFAFRGSGDDDIETIDRVKHATRAHRREEAAAFVDMLIGIAERRTQPVYVVLTMRTDFLGDCDVFFGLPEAMNRSQYLVPRMARRQLGQAINGPARLMGTSVAPRLLDQLLNDLGDRFDRLPVLQHALLRTWDYWESNGGIGQVDQEHFNAIGGLESALERDAEQALKGLDQREVRNVFKALTDTDIRQRRVRRPTLLGELVNVAGASIDDVEAIIQRFSENGRSFLYQRKAPSKADIRVDISHESLIRQWKRLREWVDEERDDRNQYLELVSQARRRANSALLLEDNELDAVEEWWQRLKPTTDWAARYSVKDDDFAVVKAYVERSKKAAADKVVAKKKARRRKWYTGGGVLVFLLGVIAVILVSLNEAYQIGLVANLLNRLAVARELATDDPTRAALVITDLDSLAGDEHEFDFVSTLYRAGGQPIASAAFDGISTAALSHDGRLVAYGRASGDIEIMSADGGGPVLASIKTAHGAVVQLQFAAHDSLLVIATDSGRAMIWTHAANRMRDIPVDGDAGAGLVHVSDDGRRIMTVDNNGDLNVWDGSSMKPVFKDTLILYAAFSRTGDRLVQATERGLELVELNTGKRTIIVKSADDIEEIQLSTDGSTVSWSDATTVWVWRAGRPPVKPAIAAGMNVGVAISPAGDMFAVADTGKIIRVFKSANGAMIGAYRGHTADPIQIVFSPDDATLFSVASDNSIHAWRPMESKGSAAYIIRGHSYIPNDLTFSDDGRWLLTSSLDSTARVWRIPPTNLLTVRLGASNAKPDTVDAPGVAAVAIDGTSYVAIAADHISGTIGHLTGALESMPIDRHCVADGQFSPLLNTRLRCKDGGGIAVQATDRRNADVVAIAETDHQAVEALFAPDGKSVVVSWTVPKSKSLVFRRYDVGTGAASGPFVSADSVVSTLAAMSHDGRWLVGVGPGAASIIDLTGKTPTRVLDKWNSDNLAATFSPNDALLATFNGDNPQIFNASGKLMGTLTGHAAAVLALAFSHSGKQIVTGSVDLTVKMWRVDKLSPIKTPPVSDMRGHVAQINTVMFSPNDSLIVSAGSERFVHVWDAVLAQHLLSLPATEVRTSAVFAKDGKSVIAVTDNGMAQQWPLGYSELRDKIIKATNVCLPKDFRMKRLVEDEKDAQKDWDECVQAHKERKAFLR